MDWDTHKLSAAREKLPFSTTSINDLQYTDSIGFPLGYEGSPGRGWGTDVGPGRARHTFAAPEPPPLPEIARPSVRRIEGGAPSCIQP
ncbi:hypothetical protein JCM30394_00240 [Deferrisoma palaeochoriense]